MKFSFKSRLAHRKAALLLSVIRPYKDEWLWQRRASRTLLKAADMIRETRGSMHIIINIPPMKTGQGKPEEMVIAPTSEISLSMN